MSKFSSNDTTLYYESTGIGTPILLTHGFAATSQIWRRQIKPFASHNQIIRWDMRGHGRSSSPADPADYSVEQTVSDMAALLDHLELDRAIIGGHSLGGYMSLAFHLAYPERVEALVLIATGPGYKSDGPRNQWNEMAQGLGDRLKKDGLEPLRKLDSEMNPDDHDSAEGLAKAAHGMLIQADSRIIDSLSGIKVPTLVVVGEKDRGYVSASAVMSNKIADAELVQIPNAGHAVHIHQTALFDAAVMQFLNRIESHPTTAPATDRKDATWT
ncbi:MAG: alpha/beta fold hydrolase [Myxococcota bacterium]